MAVQPHDRLPEQRERQQDKAVSDRDGQKGRNRGAHDQQGQADAADKGAQTEQVQGGFWVIPADDAAEKGEEKAEKRYGRACRKRGIGHAGGYPDRFDITL
ncbi:hypothetical protein AA13594_3446 [Gluconacetobacter azotocaptans DSM 13594]|nr:hypothetical protein AA13594_3446 [Gluconacetobacter azotocaptans DSM 13594]